MGLVPATIPCNKSEGLVASYELAIFAAKSSRRNQNFIPATSPMNSNSFEFVGLVEVVPATRFWSSSHDATGP